MARAIKMGGHKRTFWPTNHSLTYFLIDFKEIPYTILVKVRGGRLPPISRGLATVCSLLFSTRMRIDIEKDFDIQSCAYKCEHGRKILT